jgi:predicted nuclease of predicted toxin-antitoxin system
VKLLFDQNLSPRLLSAVGDLYPGSVHVRDAGLREATDAAVWRYAEEGGFTIVSKDSDFRQRSFLHGYPPKVVWIRRGNCSTDEIASLLREHADGVERFLADPDAAFLALS